MTGSAFPITISCFFCPLLLPRYCREERMILLYQQLVLICPTPNYFLCLSSSSNEFDKKIFPKTNPKYQILRFQRSLLAFRTLFTEINVNEHYHHYPKIFCLLLETTINENIAFSNVTTQTSLVQRRKWYKSEDFQCATFHTI